jgi:membrane protein insertase Oxa1/YidC/SpoIIIJ
MTLSDLFPSFVKATLLGMTSVLGFYFLAAFFRVDFTVQPLGEPVPVIAFLVLSLLAGAGAWLISWQLANRAKTPRTTAQVIALVVLVGSIVGPFAGTTSGLTIFWLMVTHFAIGVPLIIAMRAELPETR